LKLDLIFFSITKITYCRMDPDSINSIS